MTIHHLDPIQHPWLTAPALQRLFAVFAAHAVGLRVVGGAVRNVVMGRAISDIDLAAACPPERSEEILRSAGIKVVRTGFAFGTITAVLDGTGYEITSLRRDVSTDGRRAVVAYTDDWSADAARRDFTMNALYLDATGNVFDPVHGWDDARHGQVRFIGDAAARIAEDHLRIMRFFRFYAHYGLGTADQTALNACAAAATGMAQLSRERVTQELWKLLAAPDPTTALRLMQETGVAPYVLPCALATERLARALALSAKAQNQLDNPARLAALLPWSEAAMPAILAAALRLSTAQQTATLTRLGRLDISDATALRAALYHSGAALIRDRVLLSAADGATFDLNAALTLIAQWRTPSFPLRGEDFLDAGLSGPDLGHIKRQIEDWWIAAGFTPDRAACLAQLGQATKT